jgi:hypothetical protein
MPHTDCQTTTCSLVSPVLARVCVCSCAAEISADNLTGHETTSTAMYLALLELARHADVQAQLRADLYALSLPVAAANNASLDANTPTAPEKLRLLEALVRGSLRVHVAAQDTTFLLARPFAGQRSALR